MKQRASEFSPSSKSAQDFIDDLICQSVADVVLERLKEAAKVADKLKEMLNALSDFVDLSREVSEKLREMEGA